MAAATEEEKRDKLEERLRAVRDLGLENPEEGVPSTGTAGTNALRATFNEFDKDGSGKIDRKELKAALEKLQVVATDKQVRAMIKSVDTNQDGEVDFTEFVQLACKTHAHAVVWLTVLLVRTSSPPVSLQLCDRVSSFSDSSRLR